ncbi:hypothetical protein D3C75_680070 [compost metagenome]
MQINMAHNIGYFALDRRGLLLRRGSLLLHVAGRGHQQLDGDAADTRRITQGLLHKLIQHGQQQGLHLQLFLEVQPQERTGLGEGSKQQLLLLLREPGEKGGGIIQHNPLMIRLTPLGGFVERIGIDEHHIAGLDLVDRILDEVVPLPVEQIIQFEFGMVMVVSHGVIADSPVKFNPERVSVRTEADPVRKGGNRHAELLSGT